MSRTVSRLLAAATMIAATTCTIATAPAGAAATACTGVNLKPRVHTEAVRREGTISVLVAKLQARRDPFGMNSGEISALQGAGSAITALDQQIAATCYPTLAALRADATKLFVDYRVYWLRVPQSHAIEAADHLAEARAKLGRVEALLTPIVGSNAQAQADLATMNQALATADAKLGIAPTPGPSIAAVRDLQPAADMTSDEAALRAAHTDLVAVRQALVDARAAGLKVVADLH